MANKRIYYAIQQVVLGDLSGAADVIHGLQTVGISTNFNLEQVFEMGQLEIYQNLEDVPDVEVTLNKVLDGYPLIYVLATETGAQGITDSIATGAALTERQNARCDVNLSIYPDSQTAADGSTIVGTGGGGVVECPGMYVSSVSYTFPVDGNFTEDVTLVGNDKTWNNASLALGQFDEANGDVPQADSVNRRQHLDMAASFFPSQIPGVSVLGKVTDNSDAGEGFSTHFQNITVSCDFGREQINELGRFAPYTRYVTFPVEVTAEFEVLATEGDGINASEEGFYVWVDKAAGTYAPAGNSTLACQERFNLLDQRIELHTCEGTHINLGTKNKLSSVNYTGGDTGGGNVTISYSYTTFNDFSVYHDASPAGITAF